VQTGDILLEVNYIRLDSIDVLADLAAKLPKGQKIPMRVVRGNRALFLPLVIQ
jgi:serine protease Do